MVTLDQHCLARNSRNLSVSNEFNEYYYATSKLEPGVYIGQIKSDKGETKIIKMLKTK